MGFLEMLVDTLLGSEAEDGEGGVAVVERRSAVRLRYKIPLKVELTEEVTSAVLSDLTFTGLSLQIPKRLEVGTQLALLRDDLGPSFNGTVIWCKEREESYVVGVECELDEDRLIDSWLLPALEKAGFQPAFAYEQRKLIRRPSQTMCILSDGQGTTYYDIVMLDLSLGGALIRCHKELKVGDVFKFRTEKPGFSCRSVVRSVQPDESLWRCSLEFQEPDKEELTVFLSSLC